MHVTEPSSIPAAGAGHALSFLGRCRPAADLRGPGAAPEGAAPLRPDDYGQHEAMHAASVFALMVDNHLLNHPQVDGNPQWQALARRAVDSLWELYQGIAAVHIRER